MSDIAQATFYLTVLIICFLIVGKMSYSDELSFEKSYCEKVNDGVYPNYKELDCTKYETEMQPLEVANNE